MLVCGRVLSQASAPLPSLTKQETECVCGGDGAIKFYEGLKLPSGCVSHDILWIPESEENKT